MEVGLIVILVVLGFVNLVLLILRTRNDFSNPLAALERSAERTDRGLREEISRNRDESTRAATELRGELQRSLQQLSDALLKRINETQQLTTQERQVTAAAQESFANLLLSRSSDSATFQATQLDHFSDRLGKLSQSNNQQLELMREND